MKRNKSPLVIGLVGPKGAGKGTIAKYLALHYGAKIIVFSDILTDILEILGVEIKRLNQSNLALSLRKLFGNQVLGDAVKSKIQKLPKGSLVVIDGIRFFDDFEPVKNLPKFTLVSVDTDCKIRYQRTLKRSRNKDEKALTFARFQREENMKTETGIKSIKKYAAFTINNNGSLPELAKKIKILAEKLKLKHKA